MTGDFSVGWIGLVDGVAAHIPLAQASSTIISVALLLLIPGIIWLVIARQREGLTPHCRKCDYVLLGIGSAVCPECGQALTPANIVRGERVRRRTFWLAVGVIFASFVLIGVAVTPLIRDYDWYRIRPFSWVMQDAGSGENLRASRAWDELVRRRSVGRLSESDEQQIVEFALKEQAAAQNNQRPGPILRQLLKYLGERALAEKLSDAQKKQFLENAIRFRLRVRPVVVAGERYAIEWSTSDCGPSEGFWTQVTSQSLDVGSEYLAENPGGSALGFRFGTETQYLPAPAPGDYPITLNEKVRVSVFVNRSIFEVGQGGKLLHEWSTKTTATLHVVEKAPPEDFKVLDKPELLPQMRSAILVPFWKSESKGFSTRMKIASPPENVAFEVIFRANGREYPLGDVSLQKGKTMNFYLACGTPVARYDEGNKFDVVLRSSARVGRQTVDLHDIWKGEITIKDVPFVQ